MILIRFDDSNLVRHFEPFEGLTMQLGSGVPYLLNGQEVTKDTFDRATQSLLVIGGMMDTHHHVIDLARNSNSR